MIGFRVDANEIVATGHLMRCIAIAEACRRKNELCIFLLAEDKETERLRQRGISYRILDTKWNDLNSERDVIKKVIREEKLDWLVVDSYQITNSYLAYLEKLVPVLYIDDIKQEAYDVSAVLQYIPYGTDGRNRELYKDTNTVRLEGFKYAPLRSEFLKFSPNIIREKSMLITTGGTDTYNMAGRILEYCQYREKFKEYVFHVVVGSMNTHIERLQKLAEKNSNIVLHQNVSNISALMRQCEVALSAAGTTLLELCVCQIPTVCFSFADNQKEFAKEMDEERVVCYVGDVRECDDMEERICKQLIFFMKDEDKRNEYAARMSMHVDGKGADRIACWLIESIKH